MTEPAFPGSPTPGLDGRERMCAKCGDRPAGAGGVLCGPCLALLTEQHDQYWSRHVDQPGQGSSG